MTAGREEERRALVSWSAIAEPADREARALVSTLGPVAALAWARAAVEDPVTATAALGQINSADAARLVAAAGRWRLRVEAMDPEQHLKRAARVGARAITRGDPDWPQAMDALGSAAPYVLWVRGAADVDAAWACGIAVVGSRASTRYGEYVAGWIAGHAADNGWAVISGGAYGVDVRAHRAALDAGGVTVAVMAGGVDRLYPRGHVDVLEQMCEEGAVVAEVPPGYAPHRSRFLTRNRLIAAARATVVVEAAHRSGALSTAYHAADMGRPLAAVPGPATSASSAGCHRLIREGAAVLVSDPREVLELAGPLNPAVDPPPPPTERRVAA